jgi:hypothetical protein
VVEAVLVDLVVVAHHYMEDILEAQVAVVLKVDQEPQEHQDKGLPVALYPNQTVNVVLEAAVQVLKRQMLLQFLLLVLVAQELLHQLQELQ